MVTKYWATWMRDHSCVEVDAVVKNTVKSHEWRNGASNEKLLSQKKKTIFKRCTRTDSAITPYDRAHLCISADLWSCPVALPQ